MAIPPAPEAAVPARHAPGRRLLAFLGPAFVASIAYVDPGNFATNISGGAAFGYRLLWVVLAANLMAILIQSLAAKLGIATGRTLPQLCRDMFPRPLALVLWIAAELAAMATDLAEFLGAALGLNLLFGIPLFPAALLTGVLTVAILALERRGFRAVEWVISAMLAVIAGSYVLEMLLAGPDWGQLARHLVVPSLTPDSAYVAVGMLGATVMPHVVYLHSGLVQPRRDRGLAAPGQHFRYELVDILIAMNVAFLVNGAILVMAAGAFHQQGLLVGTLEEAYRTLIPLFGPLAGTVFAVGLLASGLSSSAVGTLAGQMILEGFTGFRMGVFLRRLVTMLPALVVIGWGIDPTAALVFSQVVLSFALPFAVVPLVWFTARADLMGSLVNRPLTTLLAAVICTTVIALNLYLVLTTLAGPAPHPAGLPS